MQPVRIFSRAILTVSPSSNTTTPAPTPFAYFLTVYITYASVCLPRYVLRYVDVLIVRVMVRVKVEGRGVGAQAGGGGKGGSLVWAERVVRMAFRVDAKEESERGAVERWGRSRM